MALEVTEEAQEILKRSLALGGVDASTGGVRLRNARTLGGGFEVQVELAAAPQDGDEIVELDGLRIFVDPTLGAALPDAIVGVTPEHERISVRPR